MKRNRKMIFYKKHLYTSFMEYKEISDGVIIDELYEVLKEIDNKEYEIKSIKIDGWDKCCIKIKADKKVFHTICMNLSSRLNGYIKDTSF